MRIYWFWPYIHADQLVVPAAVPRPGDELVVHAMRGRIAPADVDGYPFELAATLAPPSDTRERSLRWLANRSTTYAQRVVARHRTLRAGAFDVCHVVFSNYFVDGIDFRLLARRAPLVFEVHDVVPHESRVPDRVERALLALQYSAPGKIVVRHEIVRDTLMREFGIAARRITVVPWHVPEVPGVARTAPKPQPTVLFFGTLRRNKGVAEMLQAIARLSDLDARFVFAGQGFPDVDQLVRDAAAGDERIRLESGYVTAERKHELYLNADLVALPYTSFPSASAVMCDAYAYALPIVATDVGGLAGIGTDGTGWLVPPADAGALADALRAALTDTAGWQRASRRAQQMAAERTPARVGAQLRALYDEI